MIKLWLILSTSLFVLSCNISNSNKNFKEVTVSLQDSFAVITLSIPIQYDTFAKWVYQTDFSDGDMIKYRFQPKSIRLYLENGFIDTKKPTDSIENFTIEHSKIIRNKHNITYQNFCELHNQRKQDGYHQYPIKEDTIRKISGQLFSIFVFKSFDSTRNTYYTEAFAQTEFKGNFLTFSNILLTNKIETSESFIKKAKKIIESIKIRNGASYNNR